MWEKFTDQQLIDMIRSKEIRAENRAIRFLIRRNGEKAIRWVEANSGNREDGEDVFNETLAALCVNIGSGNYVLSEKATLETYLIRILRNLWYKRLRKKGIRPFLSPIEENENDYLDTGKSIEQLLIEKERDERFRQILNECLTDKERGILIGFLLEGLSMKEVANKFLLGNPENAKSHKYQIIKKLKRNLERYGFWN